MGTGLSKKKEVKEVKEGSLSARELLQQVFEGVRAQLKGKPTEVLITAHPAQALIADDSDQHRTRQGFAVYKQATVVQMPSQICVLAFGLADASYPAEQFNCDICFMTSSLPHPVKPRELPSVVREMLSRNGSYHQSILFAFANGNLCTESVLGKSLVQSLRFQNVAKYVDEHMKIDPRYLATDLSPSVSHPMTYHPSFVPILTKEILSLLPC